MEKGMTHLLVGVDARVGQLYWGKYTVGPHGFVELEGQEQACLPQEIDLPVKNAHWYGVGDAWIEYNQRLGIRLGYQPPWLDSEEFHTARALLTLAKPIFQGKNGKVTAYEAYPAYLR
jgi:tRNA threonylcarbamoyladenosine biosynthesis protein TsaB